MSSVLSLLASITLDTTAYDKGLDSSKAKAGTFGETVKKGFTKAGALAMKGLGAASAAAGAFGLASVKTGATFDSAMSQVGATMGKTAEQMQKEVGAVDTKWGQFSGNLRDYAQFMGANTSFSATQAAEALNYMALAGYNTQESMDMLPNVLNLAAAGAMNLGTASDMVTDAQSALGLNTEETNKMVDEMAKTSTKTNTSVSQLGEAILTIGATARGVKGGTAELNQVLGLLADNGIKGAEGGTHLRNMLLSLQNPTKDGVAALEELGVQVYDADGKMRALPDIFQDISKGMDGMSQSSKDTMLSGLFNKTDLAAANALIGTNKKRWDEVAEAIANCDGAAQDMADTQLDNLQGDITLFKSALEGAQIAISDGLSPSLRDFVKTGSDGLSAFTKSMKDGDMAGAIAGLGTTIANLAVEVVKKVPDMLQAGGQLLAGIGQGILQNAPVLLSTAGQLVSMLYTGVMQNAPRLVDTAVGMLQSLGQGLVTNIPVLLQSVLPMLEQFSGMLRQNAGKLVDAGMGLLLNIAQGIANSIPVLVQYIPQIVINIAGIINDNAPKLLSTGVQIIGTLLGGIISALPTIVANIPQIIQAIVSVFMAFNWLELGGNIIKFIADGVKSLATALPEAVSNIGKTAVEWLSAINWTTLGADIIDLIVIGVQTLVTAIPTALQGIGTAAVELFKAIDWLGVGSFLVQGIISGIGGLVQAAVDAIVGIGTAILNGFKSLFGINSPSTVMQELGGYIVKGLFNALSKIPGKAKEVFTGALNTIKGWASNALNTAKNAGTNVKNAVVNGFNAMKDRASSILSTAGSNISSNFSSISSSASNIWGGMKSTVGGIVQSLGGDLSTKFGNIRNTASSVFNSVKTAITNPISTAKDTIGNIIDTISGLFSDANFSFPDIKLPHFSWDWIDIGGLVSIPSISVDWYKKAYETPYLFTQPTVLGGMGFGDGNGGEMVYGHEKLMNDIRSAVNSETAKSLSQIYSLLSQYLPEIAEQNIVLNDGTLVGALAPAMDARMGVIAGRRRRGN